MFEFGYEKQAKERAEVAKRAADELAEQRRLVAAQELVERAEVRARVEKRLSNLNAGAGAHREVLGTLELVGAALAEAATEPRRALNGWAPRTRLVVDVAHALESGMRVAVQGRRGDGPWFPIASERASGSSGTVHLFEGHGADVLLVASIARYVDEVRVEVFATHAPVEMDSARLTLRRA